MSSTNRSLARETHISDYYVTPPEVIKDFLTVWNKDLSWMRILDPCAGGDAAHAMSYPYAIHKYCEQTVDTVDIREDSPAQIHGDYLKTDFAGQYDLIITNPPFNIAQDIINKALEDVTYGGYVVMLLRLNFFGSQKRKKWWQENMPVEAYVHSNRISFTEDGKTDSIEYMHCVWQKGVKPDHVKLKII